MWDIGANIGIYSILAAKWGAFVTAFEPHPLIFCRLLENIQLNSVSNNIEALPIAIDSATVRLGTPNMIKIGVYGREMEISRIRAPKKRIAQERRIQAATRPHTDSAVWA